MLASEGQHIVFERWVATDDFVTIADLGASRPGIGCPANQLAKYAVHWSDQCNVVTLRQVNGFISANFFFSIHRSLTSNPTAQ